MAAELQQLLAQRQVQEQFQQPQQNPNAALALQQILASSQPQQQSVPNAGLGQTSNPLEQLTLYQHYLTQLQQTQNQQQTQLMPPLQQPQILAQNPHQPQFLGQHLQHPQILPQHAQQQQQFLGHPPQPSVLPTHLQSSQHGLQHSHQPQLLPQHQPNPHLLPHAMPQQPHHQQPHFQQPHFQQSQQIHQQAQQPPTLLGQQVQSAQILGAAQQVPPGIGGMSPQASQTMGSHHSPQTSVPNAGLPPSNFQGQTPPSPHPSAREHVFSISSPTAAVKSVTAKPTEPGPFFSFDAPLESLKQKDDITKHVQSAEQPGVVSLGQVKVLVKNRPSESGEKGASAAPSQGGWVTVERRSRSRSRSHSRRRSRSKGRAQYRRSRDGSSSSSSSRRRRHRNDSTHAASKKDAAKGERRDDASIALPPIRPAKSAAKMTESERSSSNGPARLSIFDQFEQQQQQAQQSQQLQPGQRQFTVQELLQAQSSTPEQTKPQQHQQQQQPPMLDKKGQMLHVPQSWSAQSFHAPAGRPPQEVAQKGSLPGKGVGPLASTPPPPPPNGQLQPRFSDVSPRPPSCGNGAGWAGPQSQSWPRGAPRMNDWGGGPPRR